MSKQDDDVLHAFFDVEKKAANKRANPITRIDRVIANSRANLAQRDTIMFAFIKLWTTVAEMLAPIFAALAVKHSQQHTRNNTLVTTGDTLQK